MHKDLSARRGDLECVKGRTIGAAPWVEMAAALLTSAGIDCRRSGEYRARARLAGCGCQLRSHAGTCA